MNILEIDENKEHFFDTFENMPGGIVVYKADEKKEILYANKYVLEIYECDNLEDFMALCQGSFENLIYKKDLNKLEEEMEYQMNSSSKNFDHTNFRIITKKGNIKTVEKYGKRVDDGSYGEVYYAFIVDHDIKYLDFEIDRLTGLTGQRRFLEKTVHSLNLLAAEEIQANEGQEAYHKENMVFLYFNILNFKMLNVKYGVEKGDSILHDMADLLRKNFANSYIARFADDHFVVFTKNVDIEKRVEKLYEDLRKVQKDIRLDGKVGAYLVDDYSVNPSLACDLAKMACDSIKNVHNKTLEYYSEKIGKMIDDQYFVVNHLDEALEKGYIKPYFQPVVRAVSGDLCGMEALCRWIDPERGFISPAVFIPALENSQLIYKLDSYIIKEVCKIYRFNIDNKIEMIPVSFNLSKLDFILTDIEKVIDDLVTEYKVPHDMLNIEITESMFVENASLIGCTIDRFHSKGYKVWMDDFGSGYSSLNILKDYNFDELKIDMAFLSNFSEKSKKILKSIVLMAKEIGIKTLAEGVETKEEFEFLRDIGCEKIQGYYFGKPDVFENSVEHCTKKGLGLENRAMADYNDRIGDINFLTDKPLAVVEFDGDRFDFRFANEAMIESLKSNSIESLERASLNINDKGSPMYEMFKTFAEKLKFSGKEEVMTFPSGNQYLSLNARHVAGVANKDIYCLGLYNISKDDDFDKKEAYDTIVRNITYLYEVIALVDFEKDELSYYSLVHRRREILQTHIENDISASTNNYMLSEIYYDDQEDYMNFVDADTLSDRIKKTDSGSISSYFRTKDKTGQYMWYSHTIMVIPGTDYKRYLVVTRKTPLNNVDLDKKLCLSFSHLLGGYKIDDKSETSDLDDLRALLKSAVDYSPIKFFWKDKVRRFLGASRSFLDHYGFDSLDEILGKTDEDMNWHVSYEPYKSVEEEVLSTGKKIENKPGKCIVKGVVHNIYATKMPIYKEGRIVGLFGYFLDADKVEEFNEMAIALSSKDATTGLANSKAIMQSLIDYIEDYISSGMDFAAISLKVDGYDLLKTEYGDSVADDLLKFIAEILQARLGKIASIGRLYAARFIIFVKNLKGNELDETLYEIKKEISGISSVHSCKCTCFPSTAVMYASEVENPAELVVKLIK